MTRPLAMWSGTMSAPEQHANGTPGTTPADTDTEPGPGVVAGNGIVQRHQPGEDATGDVVAVQCGLPDVEALQGHLDKAPEAWRAATRAACEALHAAVLKVRLMQIHQSGSRAAPQTLAEAGS